MPQIVTWHEYPPIPIRNFDWGACGEERERNGEGPIGWGETPEIAVREYLMEVDDEELEEIRWFMVNRNDSAEWLPLVLAEQASRKEDGP